ncbi:P-loop containing nucleoside triphosphate hydrolase protein [Coemansia mojavensis]|nr:P-loop containing nucleoside triphosphate hydrolase protein [Coemansia mojavensis]
MDKIQAQLANASISSNKYTVDASLFDALVDKATGSAAVADVSGAAAGASRTLKQRLLQPDDQDVRFLADMLAKRLDESHGEMIFTTSDKENGALMDLSDKDVKRITETLALAAADAQANAFYAREIAAAPASNTNPAVKSTLNSNAVRFTSYLIRRRPQRIEEMMEVRVAVAGNVDAGKSTMLGVLTQGGLDDGRGKARVALFRHKHEIDSGRTSSVGMEILGFDKTDGAPVRHTDLHRKAGWDALCLRSSKIVTFLDLAGHEKYLKTTVFGMAGGAPDFVMLMVAANAGVTGMGKEHLGLALALGIPVFVVVTKIDMCPPKVLDATLKQLSKVLRSSGCRKLPVAVSDRKAVVMAAARCVSRRVCPVFQISNVTGEGVDLLQTFLNILPLNRHNSTISPSVSPASPQSEQAEMLRFDINEIFAVPYVGTVVSGVVSSGSVHLGDALWLGPDFNGQFISTQVRGIHRKRAEVEAGYRGQSVSLALRKVGRNQARKGMVLLSRAQIEQPPVATSTFEAEVVVLYHSTTITRKYQAMVHCGAVRQTARVLSICSANDENEDALRTGSRARVLFQFIRHPEHLTEGTRLVFREGRTKGVGRVTREHPRTPNADRAPKEQKENSAVIQEKDCI